MPINTVTIVGNLTRDPELKALSSGSNVCELGVAVNERVKGQDGQWDDRPSFFDVSVFGNSADACAKYLAKGRQVAINGRLRQDRWQTRDGDNRSRVRIVANDVQFVGGKPDSQHGAGPPASSDGWAGGSGGGGRQDDGWAGGGQTVPPTTAPAATRSPADDDIPF